MTDPVGEALRRSFADKANEGDPRVDLAAVHALARRRRHRHQGAVAGAAVAVALLAGAPVLQDVSRPPAEVLAGPADQPAPLRPGDLTRAALDVLGDGARVLAPEADLPRGPLEATDLAAGSGASRRTAGRVVLVGLSDNAQVLYNVRWETLEPAPTEESMRRGLQSIASDAREIGAAPVGRGRGRAVRLPQGVAAAAVTDTGVALSVTIQTGAAPTDDDQAPASSALLLLDRLAPGRTP